MAPVIRATALAVATVIVGGAASPALGAAGYHNDPLRVRAFDPPAAWQLAPQSSYPRLLASYTHPDGGRLTLTAQKVSPTASAVQLAAEGRDALIKQGFSGLTLAPDSRLPARQRLDGRLADGKRFVKQVYLVESGIGYVITLVALESDRAAMTRDFEAAAHSLVLTGSDTPRTDPDGGVPR